MKKTANKHVMLFALFLIFQLSSFLSARATELIVKAKGSKSHGTYAYFTVLVNGLECGYKFTSSSVMEYYFTVPLLKHEIKEIRIVFDNDIIALVKTGIYI